MCHVAGYLLLIFWAAAQTLPPQDPFPDHQMERALAPPSLLCRVHFSFPSRRSLPSDTCVFQVHGAGERLSPSSLRPQGRVQRRCTGAYKAAICRPPPGSQPGPPPKYRAKRRAGDEARGGRRAPQGEPSSERFGILTGRL